MITKCPKAVGRFGQLMGNLTTGTLALPPPPKAFLLKQSKDNRKESAFHTYCNFLVLTLLGRGSSENDHLGTWNTSRQRLSKSSRCTPLDGYDCSAVHQAGLEVWCTMEYCDNATCPPSSRQATLLRQPPHIPHPKSGAKDNITRKM
eukprot:2335418-Amphidinium_carterae.1